MIPLIERGLADRRRAIVLWSLAIGSMGVLYMFIWPSVHDSIGGVIERYPDEKPYPSRLILGWVTGRPLHVPAAETPTGVTLIVTVYEPASEAWDETFRIRRWERR